jgi:hypothetical protein
MLDLAVASNFARELTEEQFGVHSEERPVRRRGVVGRVFTRLVRVRVRA